MGSEKDIAIQREEERKEQIIEVEEELEAEDRPLVLKTTKVVEYLEPFMSLELLCKFPDNSAYDFDYSQSTIWSPLVPRPYSPVVDLDLIITPKKLSSDMGLEFLGARSSASKKEGSELRKNFTTTAFNLNLDFIKKQNKKKKKKMASDLSPTPLRIKGACNPIIKKGWARALKAASKQFKRWKVKREPMAHVMLPRSFRDGDFECMLNRQ